MNERYVHIQPGAFTCDKKASTDSLSTVEGEPPAIFINAATTVFGSLTLLQYHGNTYAKSWACLNVTLAQPR